MTQVEKLRTRSYRSHVHTPTLNIHDHTLRQTQSCNSGGKQNDGAHERFDFSNDFHPKHRFFSSKALSNMKQISTL